MDDQEQLYGGEGERVDGDTAQKLASGPGPVYFGCRLCPFAHRSFWAAVELGYAKQWKYIHIDLGSKKPAWYAKSINPFGTVPCLYVGSKGIFESLIVCEYINDVQQGGLLPKDPYLKSVVRLIIARFDDTCKNALYGLLMNQQPEKEEELKHAATSKLEALDRLYAEHKQNSGPFLLGDTLSLAEIAIFPFLERFVHTLQHYRNYSVFGSGKLVALNAAYEAVKQRPAFVQTNAPAEYYITAYKGYATPNRTPLPPPSGSVTVLRTAAAAALALAPVVVAALGKY